MIHRAEGSGTSYCWTDYLSKVDPEWKKRVGKGATVPWPVGTAARGNDGVAALVKQTPYAIGYVELTYAKLNGIPFGSVRNSAGVFVRADLDSVDCRGRQRRKQNSRPLPRFHHGCAGRAGLPDLYVHLVSGPRQRSQSGEREKRWWRFCVGRSPRVRAWRASLQYAPLPKELAAREIKALSAIQ